MELGTETSATVIKETTLAKLNYTSTMASVHCETMHLQYTGEEIPVVGRVTVMMQYLEQKEQLSLVVVASEGLTLLYRP